MEKPNTNNCRLLKDMLPDVTKLIEADSPMKSATPCTPRALSVALGLTPLMPLTDAVKSLFPDGELQLTKRFTKFDLTGINDRNIEKKLISKPLSADVMTKDELIDWFAVLNDDLWKYELVQIPHRQVDEYISDLMKKNFTIGQMEAAHWWIVFGKKRTYGDKAVFLPEYFYPTVQDMAQFGDKFILDEVMDARLAEQKRQFEREKSSLRAKVKELESMCAELRSIASRSSKEAMPPPKLSAKEKQSLSLAKQIVAAVDAKIVAEQNAKRLSKKLLLAEKEIKRLEGRLLIADAV